MTEMWRAQIHICLRKEGGPKMPPPLGRRAAR